MKLIEKICNLCKRLKNNKKEGKSLSSELANIKLEFESSLFFSKIDSKCKFSSNISLDIFFPDNFLSLLMHLFQ